MIHATRQSPTTSPYKRLIPKKGKVTYTIYHTLNNSSPRAFFTSVITRRPLWWQGRCLCNKTPNIFRPYMWPLLSLTDFLIRSINATLSIRMWFGIPLAVSIAMNEKYWHFYWQICTGGMICHAQSIRHFYNKSYCGKGFFNWSF